jgi:2-polyprenyl-6-methoxyphenol hydroxylase-like FAD-dependent oxidoreductase
MADKISADVAIIGGGPAGCAAAISLAQTGHSVAMLERTNYREARIGETLSPAVQPLLRELGVWERFLADGHAAAPGLVAHWGGGEPFETDHIFNAYGPGWNLNRLRFDRTLYDAACELEGVTAFSGVSQLSCERRPNGSGDAWLLTFNDGSKKFDEGAGDRGRPPLLLSARFIVGATGRAAPPFRLHDPERVVIDQLVGVVGMLAPVESLPSLRGEAAGDPRIWIEAAPDGWWYSVPLPGGTLVAVYLTDADLVRLQGGAHAAWQSALVQAPRLKSRLGVTVAAKEGNLLPDNLRVVAAHSYCRRALVGKDYLLVGDAACAWDPLSGQGVFRALTEGQMAAGAISARLGCFDRGALAEYEAHILKNFDAYLQERCEMYGSETRWPSSPFWRRRHVSHADIVGSLLKHPPPTHGDESLSRMPISSTPDMC